MELLKVPPFQDLGKKILEAKYEGLTTWVFESGDVLKKREESILTAFPKLDELATKKLKKREDDLKREKIREFYRQQNLLHIDMFNNLQQWVNVKLAYLKAKEDEVQTIPDAQQHLATYLAYKVEKDNKTNGAIPGMKVLGKNITEGQYTSDLSQWNWLTPEEIENREKEVSGFWEQLDALALKKKAILDDDLLRMQFKEKLKKKKQYLMMIFCECR